jgi:hypothetical protein
MTETKEMIRKRKLKRAAKAAVLGAVLALICRALPPEYQVACETVISLCTGGL